MLSYVEYRIGDAAQARQHAYAALALAAQVGDSSSLGVVLPPLVFLLAEAGKVQRAVELWGLASRQPWLAATAVLAPLRAEIAQHMATLPPDVAHAALQRGASRELRQTAATLADELRTQGWDTSTTDLLRVPGAKAQPLIEPLTEREQEVMQLLAEGLSNQEIADRLILAVGTVKWYTRQIYGKLGVQSRTQAIAQVRHLGLLA
jgi:ATP/maltotriose-dependent transcriptional regulator MalT